METVRVALGARSYPVHIGAGAIDAEALYRPHLRPGRIAVITTPTVAALYLERVKAVLARAGARA
jgi:3-dehydroquinate synthase